MENSFPKWGQGSNSTQANWLWVDQKQTHPAHISLSSNIISLPSCCKGAALCQETKALPASWLQGRSTQHHQQSHREASGGLSLGLKLQGTSDLNLDCVHPVLDIFDPWDQEITVSSLNFDITFSKEVKDHVPYYSAILTSLRPAN